MTRDSWEALEPGVWYSAGEIADLYRVSRNSVHRWARLVPIERRFGWRSVVDSKGRQSWKRTLEFRKYEEVDDNG